MFTQVPALLRARLAERLKLLVEYQRKQQWEKHYDLLSVLVIQGESKEQYVKRLQILKAQALSDELINFTPKGIVLVEGAPFYATIEGCAEFKEEGPNKQLEAGVEAYRENGDWYFSRVSVIAPIDGNPQLCRYSSAAIHPSPCSAAKVKRSSEGHQR